MAMTEQEKLDAKAEKAYYKKQAHHKKTRLKPGDILFEIVDHLFFLVFSFTCIFPFYYIFINTISDNTLVQK